MRIRNKQLTVRFTPDEYAALQKKAAKVHLKMEPFVRALVAEGEIIVRDPEAYRSLSKQITAIERNINQIAHAANVTGRAEAGMIRETQRDMVEIRRLFQEKL